MTHFIPACSSLIITWLWDAGSSLSCSLRWAHVQWDLTRSGTKFMKPKVLSVETATDFPMHDLKPHLIAVLLMKGSVYIGILEAT